MQFGSLILLYHGPDVAITVHQGVPYQSSRSSTHACWPICASLTTVILLIVIVVMGSKISGLERYVLNQRDFRWHMCAPSRLLFS